MLLGRLLQISGSYALPMMAIFAFLLIGATRAILMLRREWARKVDEFELALPSCDERTVARSQREPWK